MRALVIDLVHPSIVPLLTQGGLEVDYLPQLERKEILEILPQYHVLVVQSKTKIDKELIDRAPLLKVIGRSGSGLDHFDLEAVTSKGITVINSPEGNKNAVAEHTLGLLLDLMNRIGISHNEIKHGIWEREGNRGFEIEGKTVGIIGFGHMGRTFAHKLSVFGCDILVYDKYHSHFNIPYIQEVSMDVLFQKADIVSFHIPLTSETKGMVDLAYLNAFAKNVWLLNAARGEIIVTRDLIKALESGKIRGAGLDVLENEKLATLTPAQKEDLEKLLAMHQVVITPHIAGWSHESNIKNVQVLAEKILATLS